MKRSTFLKSLLGIAVAPKLLSEVKAASIVPESTQVVNLGYTPKWITHSPNIPNLWTMKYNEPIQLIRTFDFNEH